MKKIILTALCVGVLGFCQAQKINLGKAASAVSKGAQALAFSNEDAKKTLKEEDKERVYSLVGDSKNIKIYNLVYIFFNTSIFNIN